MDTNPSPDPPPFWRSMDTLLWLSIIGMLSLLISNPFSGYE